MPKLDQQALINLRSMKYQDIFTLDYTLPNSGYLSINKTDTWIWTY
ncbi:MAG TPA: hypothetical protein VJ917_07710 [Saprospiraceae bacterium]|nr:hypothetical protein [Saprospiraceae bacterium]